MRADTELKTYSCFGGGVGSTDVEGKLTVDATPMDYWGHATSQEKLYSLFQRDIEEKGTAALSFGE